MLLWLAKRNLAKLIIEKNRFKKNEGGGGRFSTRYLSFHGLIRFSSYVHSKFFNHRVSFKSFIRLSFLKNKKISRKG